MIRTMGLAAACAVFVLMALPAAARSIGNDLPWCGDVDGLTECAYASLDECERWRPPGEGFCSPNLRGDVID